MIKNFQTHNKYVENVQVVHIPFTSILSQYYHYEQSFRLPFVICNNYQHINTLYNYYYYY